jgi:hypothetical protein
MLTERFHGNISGIRQHHTSRTKVLSDTIISPAFKTNLVFDLAAQLARRQPVRTKSVIQPGYRICGPLRDPFRDASPQNPHRADCPQAAFNWGRTGFRLGMTTSNNVTGL